MNNVVVLYKTIYGNAKQYAEWIADDLHADLLNLDRITLSDLNQYDTIVIGGGIYAGKIKAISFLTKNYNALASKNIVVFATGISDPEDNKMLDTLVKKNLTPQMKESVKLFFLPSGINFKGLTIGHRIMMSMLKKGLENKAEKTEQDKLILGSYGSKIDFSNKQNIKALTLHVRSNRSTIGRRRV